MNKNTIPTDFTLSLATVDAIPVILFSIDMLIIAKKFNHPIFLVGAIICSVSGLIKVLWKYFVVIFKKNVWWMFIQMRIVMPIGFLIIMVPLFNKIAFMSFIHTLISFPSCIFYFLTFLLMVSMMICGMKLDSSDLMSNWIEQSINALAQLSLLIGLLIK